MPTIRDITGVNEVRHHPNKQDDNLVTNDFVGLELELERALPLARNMQHAGLWRVDGDGSLRDQGYEFIFSRPLQGSDVVLALNKFKEVLKGTDEKPATTVYCSSHVHIDFTEKTVEDVVKFLSVYMLLEDGLARYCGDNRENNLFCLTVSNAEEQLDMFSRIAKTGDIEYIRRAGGERAFKYSALNLACLWRYGTIESRLAGGLTDTDQILKWINILLSIKKYSESLDSPMDVLQTFSMQGFEGFLHEVMPQYANELREYMTLEEMMDGVDRVQYMLTA